MRYFWPAVASLVLASGSLADEPPAAPRDTLEYSLPAVDVEGPRIPLGEIVRRARERESERAEGTPGVSFSRFRKIVMTHSDAEGRARRRDVVEEVHRVRVVARDRVEVVTLRQREYRTRADSTQVEKEKIDTGIDFDEFTRNILGFTVALDRVESFDYTLLDRRLFGDYLVYRIGFRPKSPFEPLPSGEVWIETGDFVVLHENAWVRDVVPFPLLIESIDRISRERERVEGRWVWTRQQLSVRTRLGALGGPDRIELCDTHGDYRFPEAEAGGEWLVGGRRGAAELEAYRRALADSSAARFSPFTAEADFVLADSLGQELERVGFDALRKERGGPRSETELTPLSGPWGLNRVDGARPGLGLMARRGLAGAGGWAAYATSARRWMGEARLELSRERPGREAPKLTVSLADRTRAILTNEVPGAGLVALLGLDDPLDHYRRREAAIALSAPAGRGFRAALGYSIGEDRPLARTLDRHPFRSKDYRPNPAARPGDRTVLSAEIEGAGASAGLRIQAEVAAPEIGPSDLRYGRAEIALGWEPAPVGPVAPRFHLRAGHAPGAPLQRKFSLGGGATLHALAPNERVGESLLFGRAEAGAARSVLPAVRLPLVGTLRPQPALLLEWGALRSGGARERGIADLGVAVDQYIGLFSLSTLRVTAAWRLPEGAPRFGLEFRGGVLR